MEKRFIEKWDKNKGRFKEWLKVYHNGCDSYNNLVKAIIENVLNEEDGGYENYSSEVQEVDFGDYQGTLIFLFTKKCYQPCVSDTFYTSVGYGSCSGCDTMEAIWCEKDENVIIDDLMTLSLHIIQNMRSMREDW